MWEQFSSYWKVKYYTTTTQLSHNYYTTTTQLPHNYYTTTTQLLHYYHTTTTQLLHNYHTTTTLLLHYYYTTTTLRIFFDSFVSLRSLRLAQAQNFRIQSCRTSPIFIFINVTVKTLSKLFILSGDINCVIIKIFIQQKTP